MSKCLLFILFKNRYSNRSHEFPGQGACASGGVMERAKNCSYGRYTDFRW